MKLADIPTKVPTPFAVSAGPSYIRQIPIPSQIPTTPGAASFTDGFPPLNFLAIGAGGVPPFGEDMNGILFQITQWVRWQNAGGLLQYDSAFATGIGGYPKNALLLSKVGAYFWLSTADDNLLDPDAGSPNWTLVAAIPSVLLPLMDGAASAGVAIPYAREDHRHPTDTNLAALITASGDAALYRLGRLF